MIAKFPKFSSVTIEHQREIRSFTRKYEPYSDFDFTSLFCWSAGVSNKVSKLNGNLIIRLPDYISGETIFSVLGKKKIDKTLKTLLETTDKLKLVPQTVVDQIKDKDSFIIKSDRDQFDYIYKLNDHVSLRGQYFKSKRKQITRFIKANEHNTTIKIIDFNSPKDKKTVINIFDKWSLGKDRNGEEIQAERQAILRLLKYAAKIKLMGLIIYVSDQPQGFSITEKVNKGYAMYHFHKTLPNYPHIDTYFTQITSKKVLKAKSKFINWEQDMGLRGLRITKNNYKPVKYLKKYVVSLK